MFQNKELKEKMCVKKYTHFEHVCFKLRLRAIKKVVDLTSIILKNNRKKLDELLCDKRTGDGFISAIMVKKNSHLKSTRLLHHSNYNQQLDYNLNEIKQQIH